LVSGTHDFKITFEDNERQYEVQVPLSYDNAEAVPLVFNIHGFSSNMDQQELVSGFSTLAEEKGFVVLRPNGFGLVRSWNGGDVCCGKASADGLDDVGLMKAIVKEISTKLCINPRKIYATGISNGGALAHRIACEAADVFAAVAPVSYPLDFDPFDKCKPSRPIAIMHLHGKNDITVPYDGGIAFPSTPDSFAFWSTTNNCSGETKQTYSKGKSSCDTYEKCGAGTETSLCSINGGHVLYVNLDGAPVAELAWKFLSKHKLPQQ